MVRRISGKYKANTVSHLKYNNNDITDVKEICNTFAKQYAFNSSYSHRKSALASFKTNITSEF